MRVVWGVFSNSNQCVATFDYPKKGDADAKAAQLTADKRSTHFVQPVKEPIEEKKEEKPKRGFGLGNLLSGGTQASNQQASAAAGAKGMGNDRSATGGTNRSKVPVKIERAELDAFRKGIA